MVKSTNLSYAIPSGLSFLSICMFKAKVVNIFGQSCSVLVYHATTPLSIMILIFFNCQGIESTNLSYKSLEHLLYVFKAKAFKKMLLINQLPWIRGQVVKLPNFSYTIPRVPSLDSSVLLSSEFQLTSCTESLGSLLFVCSRPRLLKKMLLINQLPWIRGQVVKSPNLSYTIPRASSLDSSILLSSEFSQCLRVQGQGCYTFSCISANASREL